MPRVRLTAHRMLLRGAYPVLRLLQRLLRLRIRGTKCVLHRGDEVVLVRHTYGRGWWDLPGGWVRAGEDPLATGRREVAEELAVEAEQWHPVGRIRFRDNPRHVVFGYAGAVESPHLQPEPAEIAEARWFHHDALPLPLAPWVRAFVDGHYSRRP